MTDSKNLQKRDSKKGENGRRAKKRGKGKKVCKEIKREKKGKTIKKLVTYLMLFLCVILYALEQGKGSKKRDLSV